MSRYFYIRDRRRQHAPRVFRDRNNPLDFMDDREILNKYRLDRATIFDLCRDLNNDLARPTNRCKALPVSLQVLIALRFYATGSFQSILADSHGVSVLSVSRSIHSVSEAIPRNINEKIKFPSTPDIMTKTKQDVYDISAFPNVIGAVDGTFIPIKAPSQDEHLYVTRKGFHAINVQGICNANNMFLNLVIRWPGSTHDAFIWNNCAVARSLEGGNHTNTWLLGDSAYPLKKYLLTPIVTPTTHAERRYNTSHKITRCVVERTFGMWKMRFRCLHKSGGYLIYSPGKCIHIISATGVLHNICSARNLPLPDDDGQDNDQDIDDDEDNQGFDDQNIDGRRVRDIVINRYFR